MSSKAKVPPAPAAPQESAARPVPLSEISLTLRNTVNYLRTASLADLAQLLAVLAVEVQGRTQLLEALKEEVQRRHDAVLQREPTVTPEQTLRAAGIGLKRQAAYQRKMSTLLAGRPASATEAK